MPGAFRRSFALAAATASLSIPFAAAAPPARAQLPCVPVLTDALVLAGSVAPGADVQALLAQGCIDTPAELAALLDAADPAQLRALLAGYTPEQLAAALVQLRSGGDLQGVAATLSPAQIQSVLSDPAALAAVIEGLRQTVVALAAGTPPAAAVDQLIAQVGTVLAAALPGDTSALNALLGGLVQLLGTPGIGEGQLRALQAALAGSPAALLPGGSYLLSVVNGLLGSAGGGGTGGGGTGGGGTGGGGTGGAGTGGGTPATGGGTPATGGGTPATGGSGGDRAAYRGRITKIAVTRSRRRVRLSLLCPAGTPGCVIALTGRVAGRPARKKAKWAGLLPGTSQTVTVRLRRSTARRLKARGGKVSFTATTVGSSLPPTTRTLKVKRGRGRR